MTNAPSPRAMMMLRRRARMRPVVRRAAVSPVESEVVGVSDSGLVSAPHVFSLTDSRRAERLLPVDGSARKEGLASQRPRYGLPLGRFARLDSLGRERNQSHKFKSTL